MFTFVPCASTDAGAGRTDAYLAVRCGARFWTRITLVSETLGRVCKSALPPSFIRCSSHFKARNPVVGLCSFAPSPDVLTKLLRRFGLAIGWEGAINVVDMVLVLRFCQWTCANGDSIRTPKKPMNTALPADIVVSTKAITTTMPPRAASQLTSAAITWLTQARTP